MFQLNNEKQVDFRKYQQEPIDQIYLSFSPNQDEQNTLNLKTEDMSVPNIQSFLTDHTNLFDQRICYYQGQATHSDPYDYYLVSKNELLKILKQLETLQQYKQKILQQSQVMNEGQPHKDVISVRAIVGHRDNSIYCNPLQQNKENIQTQNITRNTSQRKPIQQNYSSVKKLNQPLPSRQRSQTHINLK